MNILKIINVKYSSDKDEIIKGINLTVEKGDCISIVGQSGSGKSTFLKMLSDLISPTGGAIYYNGKDYKEINPIELRRKISYCIQIPYLFGESVYENLAFPFEIRNTSVDEDEILKLLELLKLDKSYLNKKVDALSGGEKQRIALIRNLLSKPDILLLDEVTSGLDKENTKIVQSLIKKINEEGMTILWITHDMDQSKSIFNKRVHIDEGKIIKEENLASCKLCHF
ncbi:ABC transporter ATP-binding protein [Paraclostridium bifermentans]|uniref:ABC transporter ATP-binding protein n=1 Tax=Paraclostridium bifermentans TaxID=1490 RepID=UPI00359C5046